MSNHFSGLKIGPPQGDPRLDLCDLYAFQAPSDASRIVLILNANYHADALHPDAIYRLAIDTDGDFVDDVAFSFVYSAPQDGRQTVTVFLARGEAARSPEPLGDALFTDVDVSFTERPNVVSAGGITFAAGARSEAFFFDSDGINELFDSSGNRNFTTFDVDEFDGQSPWTGKDANTEANIFSMALELPSALLDADGPLRVWGRCSLRENGALNHVDRAGHPNVASFFNTDDTKVEYNAGEPASDWERWLEQFVHLLGHTGNYTREEAIAALEEEGTLPDVLTFDPSRPARYPNGRTLTDDTVDYRLAFISKGDIPPSGLSPHDDLLDEFPYLGPPHAK